MPRVDLIYDMDCPNIRHARRALLEAFSEARLQPAWTEWDRKSPESPAYVRQYGSPTILVDGRDVGGAEPGEGADSCRIYGHPAGGLKGIPPVQAIVAALGHAGAPRRARAAGRVLGGWRLLASVPSVGAALLPVGVCPACWPAYAGILGSVGLGFLFESTYLLPVTISLLGLALLALAFRARIRRGFRPFILGMVSACFVLAFKFVWVFDPLVYTGLFGLVAASVWNAWPNRPGEAVSCPRCVPQEPAMGTNDAP